jgi:hypothetical protein
MRYSEGLVLLAGLFIALFVRWPFRRRKRRKIRWEDLKNASPQIWFVADGAIIQEKEWQEVVLSPIQVVEFASADIIGSPGEYRGIAGNLKVRRIAIAVRVGDFRPDGLRHAGIDPAYITLDLSEVGVEEAAFWLVHTANSVRKHFPLATFILLIREKAIRIGPEWLVRLLDQYHSGMKEYPVAVRFDIEDHEDWAATLLPFTRMLESRRIGYGISIELLSRKGVNELPWWPDHIVMDTKFIV